MAKVKVTILSKQSIKPSHPTCNADSIPLSLFDQLAPPIYTHMLFFYSMYSLDIPHRLKSSLSKTLDHFYPFAGRIRDTGNGKLHVECNDEGVEFVEARVVGATLESIRHQGPAVKLFNELLPIKKSLFDFREDRDAPLLGVQISAIDGGGGFVLGVSICHLVADGASLSMFLHWWSRTACGISDDSSPVAPLPPRYDCASVFPPQDITTQCKSCKRSSVDSSGPNQDVAIRCFKINSEAMERLKQVDGGQPTRVEAVSALIWRCIKRAQAENNILSLSHVVNFRNRMAPLLSQESMGNMFLNVEVTDQLVLGTDSFVSIEQSIRTATRQVNEQLVRSKARQMLDEREGKGTRQGTKGVPERIREWIFSSWCRMGWYECSFGFEDQPVWVACGITAMKDVCILVDAKDGHGMEVWLWMECKDMERIVSDIEFQKFVCFS